MDWNLTDLTKLLGLSAGAYALVRVSVGKPLVQQVVNPNRWVWFFAGAGFLSGAAGLLRWETKSPHPLHWLTPLQALVTDEKTNLQVMLAAFGLFNGVVVLGLVGYCRARLPRDPSTFHRAKDRARVVRYYVRLRGGMDFAALVHVGKTDDAVPTVVADGVERTAIAARLPDVCPGRTADEQLASWTALAVALHRELNRLAGVLAVGGQGPHRRVLLDVQYGGYLFQYVRPPEIGDEYQFVFAATLSQAEVDTRRFEQHFDFLVTALRHIRSETEKA